MRKFSLSAIVFFILLSPIFGQNQKHIVKKGENIYRISLKYGVSMASIFEANPGSKDLIKSGQILYIPSNDKTSNGTVNSQGQYVVKKGETKFGLSQRFGISIAQLEKDNPQIVNGLQAGHLLNVSSSSITTANNPATIATTGNTHRMKKGETFWSVSKTYGTTVQELLELNKGIDINDLSIGQSINIPSNDMRSNTQVSDYVVVKGDTKYSLSKRFNLSISDLEALNPQIKPGLKPGQQLSLSSENIVKKTLVTVEKEPSEEITEVTKVNPKTPEPQDEVVEETVMEVEKATEIKVDPRSNKSTEMTSWFESANKTKAQNVTWLVPYDKGSFTSKLEATPEAEKSELSLEIERYKGSQKAILDLKSRGFVINQDVIYNSDMSSNTNLDSNLIIGILSKAQIQNTSINQDNSGLYLNLNSELQTTTTKTFPTLNPLGTSDIRTTALINYVNSKNGNLVIIDDQNIKNDNSLLLKLIPNAKLIETESNDTFKESDLLAKLSSSKPNIVLIKSDKASVFLNTTNALLRQFSKYDLQIAVLNKSLIPSGAYISSKRFRILKLLFPSLSKIDLAAENPTTQNPSEAYMNGYDSTLDALLRLCQEEPLQDVLNKTNSNLKTKDFIYSSDDNGYIVNKSVFLYQYDKDSGFIKL